MTTVARMDISVPSVPVTPVAEARPRVDSIQGVAAVTEQVPAPPQSEGMDQQNGGNGAGNSSPKTDHGVYYDKELQAFIQISVDDTTGRVVRTYPDDATLARMARMNEAVGRLLDTKT